MILTPCIVVKMFQQNQKRLIMAGPVYNTVKDDGRVTAVLFGVVILLTSYDIIFVLPITVLHNAAYELKISAFASNDEGFNLFKEVSQLLEQLNYSLNFFLYVMTSYRFRSVFRDFFTCRNRHRPW